MDDLTRLFIQNERIINNKWVIKIPKQPQLGIWRHTNDSYRELAMLLSK